ncbi:ubiquinol-cytochrome c reductase iron-sulfur subunit [Ahrensia sp. R2A130]|uniref:ubiquinol-cytochrome c reductase iron-sulfur subunit n=1 Tax=Ahrensia sp. R2A130 TaxID=744979 RepID=UPI0001E0F813|nr:ubiquinol-cytochrome c reductase iron-sulfur subunit [Ahrensia sp. R2A130]EFL91001.1 ubiquinol-Cytochrome c reductase, iron-sulfur subunit [Ahrensia sp. R2A130]
MSSNEEGATRRDFLYIATGAAAAVAAGGVVWPLVAQMAPNDREKAAGAPQEIDVSSIEPGMVVTVVWRGKPYFIRHLTEEEVAAAADASQDIFRDFETTDIRLSAAGEGDDTGKSWAVMAANCTHLGCVPSKVEPDGDNLLDGWVCPCHGSKFDVTGRVTKGPAAINLPLPPYRFASAESLVIGEA